MNLGAAVDRFLTTPKAFGFTQSTIESFHSILRQFLSWLDQLYPEVSHPAEVTDAIIADYVGQLETDGRPVSALA